MRIDDCHTIDISQSIVHNIIDLNPGLTKMNIHELNLSGVRNMGDIFIAWDDNHVLDLISNQKSTTLHEKAEQFRLLKEEFRDTGRYIDEDIAQGTGVAKISGGLHTDADSSLSGEMFLFSPSSTTFVKHFLSDNQRMDYSVRPYTNRWLAAGYMNTTSAINAIQFSMTSGNIDSGKIKLYGIKDS